MVLSALLALPGSALAQEGPVGGALVGWGLVPLADEAQRTDGSTHLWGQLQTWATAWDQDVTEQADPATYGDPEHDPGFTVARARLGFDGFVPMGDGLGDLQVDYALSVGVASPYDVRATADEGVQLVDAFGRVTNPWAFGVTSLAVGVQRVPFSREAMMSSAELVFQERAVSTSHLAPSREAGAQLGQSIALGGLDGPQILLRGGVFNGNGDLFGDTDPGVMGAARAEVVVGDAYRTWSPELAPALGVGASWLTNREIALQTTSMEADLLARVKIVTLMGEIVRSTIDIRGSDVVDPDLRDGVTRMGWMGQLSVWIPLREQRGIEVAGRYATFDDDRDLRNAGDVAILHAGATVRDVLPQVDLGAGYIHRGEATEIDNDTIRIWAQFRPEVRL